MMNVNNDPDTGCNNTAKQFVSSLSTNTSVPFNLNNRLVKCLTTYLHMILFLMRNCIFYI